MKGEKNVKNVLSISALFVLSLLFLSGCQDKGMQAEQTSSSKTAETVKTTASSEQQEQTAVPTLFFHGYSGTINSFKGMLQRLEQEKAGKNELLLTVAADGSIQAQGELSGKADDPMVQVVFSDNQNNEWNQTEWIKNSLVYLKETYGISKVNIIGHSMGGVSALRYLVTYGQDTSLPKVEKFAALGAPFNDFVEENNEQTAEEVLANGPSILSSRYQDYQQNIQNLPSSVSILLVGGQISETDLSDGTVPLSSAFAVAPLLKQHGNSVEEQIIKGAAHSQLHESKEVDQLVSRFIWDR
ncbi:hypothetical protein D920_01828 [Enterococcus faecalis 13-SD-W-01]|nr:hypothetical protein D920_01828 [Enterococcus faecalis 13-SD-W-01]